MKVIFIQYQKTLKYIYALLYVIISFYTLYFFTFFGHIGILHYVYGFIFANLINNTAIISTDNCENSNIIINNNTRS